MKLKKVLKPLLIITIILSGLSTIAPRANARHVRYRRVLSYRYYQRGRRIRRPVHHFRNRRIRFRRHRIRAIHHRRFRRHAVKQRIRKHRKIKSVIQKKRRHHRKQRVDVFKFKRPTAKDFQIIDNHTRDLKNATWEAWGKKHRETVKSYSGPKVTFKTVRFLPLHPRNIHMIQSIAVTPSGRFAFLGCDAYPYLSGYTRIMKVNLQKRHGGIEIGPRFKGGHGQALAYNSKRNQLWLLTDHYGPMNHGSFDEISTHSLKPIHKTNFKLDHEDLGNVLTFDNSDNIYNEDHIRQRMATKQFKDGSLIFYKGQLTPHKLTLARVDQGLKKSPGFVIQGMAYNRRTKRLYLETDEAIMSLPIRKLGKLRPGDVKETILHGHREYEGISFDKYGHAYIALARPNEILRSTQVF